MISQAGRDSVSAIGQAGNGIITVGIADTHAGPVTDLHSLQTLSAFGNPAGNGVGPQRAHKVLAR